MARRRPARRLTPDEARLRDAGAESRGLGSGLASRDAGEGTLRQSRIETAEPSGAERLAFLRRRGGVYLNRSRRSVWVHARDPDDFVAASGVLKWIRGAVATDRLLLTSSSWRTCCWLAARFPNDNVLPPPWGARPLVGRFFRQLRPLMLVCVGDVERIGVPLLDRARRDGVPVALVDVAAPPSPAIVPYLDLCCVRTAELAGAIAALGVPLARIRVTGSLRGDAALDAGPCDDASQRTIAAIEPSLATIPSPPEGVSDRTAPRRMDELARSLPGRLVVATRRGRRCDGWEALAERLGRPATILCLGNGPSSEDPRLAGIAHDALFRVNWRWLERGLLTQPDMVFVGDLRTTSKVRDCVFGFRTVAWESEVLLRHLLLNGSLRRLEYFTCERASPFLNDDRWPAHPTNGVVMVATAAALNPRRLVVAGIDLYLDPRGRYPGDATPDNDLPQMHSREVELEILERSLADFEGEVTILSEPLRGALAARRHGRES